MTWRTVCATAVGSSHIASETPCQDRLKTTIVRCDDGAEVLIAVVSDGAGSARFAEAGAEAVCANLASAASNCLAKSSNLDDISEGDVRSFFTDVREDLRETAEAEGSELRDFAATALLTIVSIHQAICVQVGDGGIVVRESGSDEFMLAFWPEAGEYANQTFFVTDSDVTDHIMIRRYDGLSDIMVFSDGLQRIALQSTSKSIHAPFVRPIINHIRASENDDATLSHELQAFLSSDVVNQRTDDDKSLIVACRL